MSNKTQLPDDVRERIKTDAAKSTNKRNESLRYQSKDYGRRISFIDGYEQGYVAGATTEFIKLHEAQQENEHLRRWKMEAAELLTKINSYAHKHLEIKLGQCAVEFVIAQAKERDRLKERCEKMEGRARGLIEALEQFVKSVVPLEGMKMLKWTDEVKNISQTSLRQWKEGESNTRAPISQDAHEKEVMMQAFNKARQIFEGRVWIMEGRGSYPYNDDRYQEEVRYMFDEFDQLQKDTWGNIISKSGEYREWIIDEYLHKDHPAIHDILNRLGYQRKQESNTPAPGEGD